MNKIISIFLVASVLFPVFSQAQIVSLSSNEQIADRILEINGTSEQMKEISDYLVASFSQTIDQGGGESNDQLTQLVKDSFKGDVLLATIRQYLLEKFNSNYAQAVLEWYQTPFGKKIVRLEILSTKPQALSGKEDFQLKLIQNAPSQETFRVFKELDKALHATEDSIEGQLSVQEAMYKAFMKNLDVVKLTEILDLKRQQLQFEQPNQTLTDLMYRYDELSLQEIQQYIDFLNSPPGQWITLTLSEGARNAMKQNIDDFAEKFVQAVKDMSEDERQKVFGVTPSDDLKEYKMEDEGFSIILPVDSKIQEYALQMKDNYGQMRIKVIQGKTKDSFFNFSYGQYPANFVKDNDTKKIFEQSLNNLLQATKSEITVSKYDQWQGYPAFYFEVKSPLDVFIKGRFVLVSDKIYQLTAYIDKFSLEKSAPKVIKVLESLKINS